MGNVVKPNTRETVPSDGPKREPEGRSLQQSPPPASGSGSEEVVDAEVYRVVWGPVVPGGLGGNPPPSWGPEYPLRWPKTSPPGRNPPSRPSTGERGPGAWNREVLGPGISPHPPLWRVGGPPPPAVPLAPPQDHQQVSGGTHEKWEKHGND